MYMLTRSLEARWTPGAPSQSELEFGECLKADQKAAAGEDRTVELDEGLSGPQQVGAEHVGVDDDRGRALSHGSAGDGVEEGALFLVAEIVDHRRVGSVPRPGALELLLNR